MIGTYIIYVARFTTMISIGGVYRSTKYWVLCRIWQWCKLASEKTFLCNTKKVRKNEEINRVMMSISLPTSSQFSHHFPKLVFERDFVDFISIISLFLGKEINKQRGSDSWWLPHILCYIHIYFIFWSVKGRLRENLQTQQKKSGHMLLCFHKVGWDREIKCW